MEGRNDCQVYSQERELRGVKKLNRLNPKTALVIRGGEEREISVEDVLVGDLILVRPGKRVPVDGIISEGYSINSRK